MTQAIDDDLKVVVCIRIVINLRLLKIINKTDFNNHIYFNQNLVIKTNHWNKDRFELVNNTINLNKDLYLLNE